MASLLLTMVLPMLSVITLPPDPLILAASSGSDAQWSLVKLRASLSLDEVQEEAMIHPVFERSNCHPKGVKDTCIEWPVNLRSGPSAMCSCPDQKRINIGFY